MRRIKLIILIFLFIPFVSNSQTIDEHTMKFWRVLNQIGLSYVDVVDKSKLTEAAVIAMLKELDPHSYYITKEEMSRVNEDMKGSFEGIGVQFQLINDTLVIISPISGGPSEKVGIMAGDRIIFVDGENIAGVGITNEKVFKKLRGDKGTQVTLGIKRGEEKNIEYYNVIRDVIPVHSLDASYMIDNEVGYIKLNRFSETTKEEYQTALKDLQKKGMKHLILDLTGNPGGLMNMAVDLSDEFLEKGQLIVYSEGLKARTEEYKATTKGNFLTGKLVIMVDRGSASASEIVAGAVQDWDRGVIVGRRTFGKGLVQKQHGLPDGSAFRLTVARYHTPTGRVVQKPYEMNDKEYHKEVYRRSGENYSADSIEFPDSLKYSTLKRGRTVYGGGGIMPDIFVPIDTTDYSEFYLKLLRKRTFTQFIMKYLDTNRDNLKKTYKTSADFDKKFVVNDKFLNEFYEYANKTHELSPKEGELERSERSIKIQLKALLARNLYDQNAFYKAFNEIDPIFRKAYETIKDNKAYEGALCFE